VREWRQLSWPGTSSSGEGPFSGSLLVPALGNTEQSGPTHTVHSLTAVVSRSELGPVRLPQPQPRLASRARRRSPDSATYQRETRAHQRTTIPHTKKRFRSLRCSPDRSRPSCEQHGAGTSSFRKKPRLVPRRYLPYRPRCSELAVRAATQRPTRPHPEHPLSLTRHPPNLKRLGQSTGQPRPPLSPPARTGLVVLKAEVPLNPSKAQTEALLRRAGMPHFPKKKPPPRWEAWGHPHAFFTDRLGRP
jgi:hypothetical protein